MRWTEDQLAEYQERNRGVLKGSRPTSDQVCMSSVEPEPDVGPESKLQERIERYCTEKGWYWFHDLSRRANRPGHPDLVIALPCSRTLWIELKSRQGRLKKEQEKAILALLACGHEAHVVRSFKAFLEIVNGKA